jgi:uncharacterized membrane protein
MSTTPDPPAALPGQRKPHSIRRALLRGMGLVMPPLLTVVVFLWAWSVIDTYVLRPVESIARTTILWSMPRPLNRIPEDVDPAHVLVTRDGESFSYKSRVYVPVENQWIPQDYYDAVKADPGKPAPRTAEEYYARYAQLALPRQYVIPVFLLVFILLLYLAGKFLAAGVGRVMWNLGEGIIHRLPIIRNVYSSAKQVTDFVFSEREVEYTRVVAVEYPRKGIYSLGFVTGESMLDIRAAANEPVLSVLMPTSPMPVTGFTITVPRSETIDLDITIDQALQFVVSCGVVVPPHQMSRGELAMAISSAVGSHGSDTGDGNSGDGNGPKLTGPTADEARSGS